MTTHEAAVEIAARLIAEDIKGRYSLMVAHLDIPPISEKDRINAAKMAYKIAKQLTQLAVEDDQRQEQSTK